MSVLSDAAEYYARELGFAVFPLLPNSKRPAVANGVKDATTDVETIAAGWAQNPSMNVAIACGEPSGGLLVIDVDVDGDTGEDGMEFLAKWEREHGELPETVSAITGRGGSHLYYRVNGRMKNSVNPDVGVDIRCDGGYVMAPPSIHPNGNAVEWENDPHDYEVAMADDNVLAFVEAVRPNGFGKRGRKVDPTKVVKKGGRNNALFKALASARSAGSDDDVMEAFAYAYNASKLDPPLPPDEVRRTLESVIAYEPGNKEVEAKAEQSGAARSNAAFKHNVCARHLMDEQGACFVDGMPAIRSGGVYRTGWLAIDDAIIDMSDDVTRQKQNEVHHYLTVKAPRVEQSRPTLIGFANGVLDIDTMELRGYRDDDVIPNVIPHAWNPSAECDAVDCVIEKLACGDVGMEMNLTEVIGLCMYRSSKHYPFSPVLMGTGSNGKSTYISMLRTVIGAENMSALQPKEIGQRFQAAMMLGKLANLGDDISNDYLDADSCAVIKKVATGDPLYTDVKGGEGFTFRPYATMVFSANRFPRLGDSSDGMMRRLFPMPFNAHFSSSDPDFDPMIGDRLESEDAAEYMCVIGVEGLRRVIAQSAMTPNAESVRLSRKIKVDNNSVLQWMEDEGLGAPDAIGRTKDELYSSYKTWCADNGAQYVGSRNFGDALRDEWHVALCQMDHREFSDGRKTVRVYGFEK
jgi:putative DNA primase/helicase|nr:MAG TPA: dsDNA helicase [Caudoviricetes sp.]